MSTANDPSTGWVARSFTRARVMGTYLARIPLGDKSFDLPAVLNRAQLLAAVCGAIIAVIAWGVGTILGLGAWLCWPVAAVTAVIVIAIKFAPVPDRGASLFIGGHVRMALARLPFASTHESSVARHRRRPHTVRASMRIEFHAAPVSRPPAAQVPAQPRPVKGRR